MNGHHDQQLITESQTQMTRSQVERAIAFANRADELRGQSESGDADFERLAREAVELAPETLPNGPIVQLGALLASLLERAGSSVSDGLRARALLQLGSVQLLAGDTTHAITTLYEATVLAASSAELGIEARAALALGYARACDGNNEWCHRALDRAERAIGRSRDALLSSELSLAGAWARTPSFARDRALLETALTRFCYEAAAHESPFSWHDRLDRIGADGSWFEVRGVHVDLSRRPVLRRVLAALVARHRANARAITLTELLAIGWPQERFIGESGPARVYQTIKRLRQMGLGELLDHDGTGYSLKGSPTIVDRAVAAA
jgi:hypothetical protein